MFPRRCQTWMRVTTHCSMPIVPRPSRCKQRRMSRCRRCQSCGRKWSPSEGKSQSKPVLSRLMRRSGRCSSTAVRSRSTSCGCSRALRRRRVHVPSLRAKLHNTVSDCPGSGSSSGSKPLEMATGCMRCRQRSSSGLLKASLLPCSPCKDSSSKQRRKPVMQGALWRLSWSCWKRRCRNSIAPSLSKSPGQLNIPSRARLILAQPREVASSAIWRAVCQAVCS
mmetsp:Transcript_29344/g.68313  ORF Transcript_29344/g.68313 Transcript_29344/m.68313 type:complete len:223 (+) Transcript_29344:924-1592(+)